MKSIQLISSVFLIVFVAAMAGAAQNQDIVLYYPFDEGRGDHVDDLSRNGFDGELSGKPEWVDGKFSGGLRFAGNLNEFVQINGVLPIGSGDNTVCIWVNVPEDAAGRVGILLGNYPDGPNSNWELHSNGQMRVWWNNGNPDLYGSSDIRDGEWHHLTFIRESGVGFSMYLDGELETEPGGAAGTDIEFVQLHRIGGDNRGANSPWLQATIDDMVIFDRVLNSNEIKDLANAAYDPNAIKGAVLYYSFDEGVGDQLADGSGTGLDGEISGAPEWVDGMFSKGLKFSGKVDDYVQIGKPLPIGSGSNTVAVWVRVPKNAAGRAGVILGNYPSTPNSNWELHSNGQMRVWWNNGNPDLYGTTDLRDDEWHHLTFVRDTDTGKFSMYIDGKRETVPGGGGGAEIEFTTAHRVGGDNRGDNSPWLQATVDELVIYSKALTKNEVQGLLSGPAMGPGLIEPSDKLSSTWGKIKAR